MPQWERKRHGAMVQEALPGKNDGAAPVNIAVVWNVSSKQSNEAGTRCYQNQQTHGRHVANIDQVRKGRI